MKVIRMADYGRRMRRGLHAQLVHDQIAQALKASNRVLPRLRRCGVRRRDLSR